MIEDVMKDKKLIVVNVIIRKHDKKLIVVNVIIRKHDP